MPLAELYRILAEVRALGYSYSEGTANPGGAALALLLPTAPGEMPLALGIAGIAEVMRPRKDALLAILHDAVARYLAEASVG